MRTIESKNGFFDLISARQRGSFVADLQPVEIRARDLLSQPGKALAGAYFPTSAVISMLCRSKGDTVDVRGVGREGMLGSAALGAGELRFEAVCQIGGTMLHMPGTTFRRHTARSPSLRSALSAYASEVLAFTTQSVACNALHTIDRQCARWLLVTQDRAGTAEFSLTHELLARMLGVRRSGISVAVSHLQRSGFVRYKSGIMTIVDRGGLERASCDCYREATMQRPLSRQARPAR